MKQLVPYEESLASRLLPLLESIACELQERGAVLRGIESRLQRLHRSRRRGNAAAEEALLVADAAEQRRELRHVREELERLGCSVVGDAPLTLRIPISAEEGRRSLLWQAGAGLRSAA